MSTKYGIYLGSLCTEKYRLVCSLSIVDVYSPLHGVNCPPFGKGMDDYQL